MTPSGVTASNGEVASYGRDAPADVVTAGREPSANPLRPGWIRLFVVGQAVALIGLAAVALHYRAEAGLRRPYATGAAAPVSLPEMASATLRLPVGGTMAGTAVIVAAAQPGAGRAQFVVSAVISGGQPDMVYDLIGNDCSAVAPLPDHVWATGFTNAAGTAELTGYAWVGAVRDVYWLALKPSPTHRPPGLRGMFAEGAAAPFPAGQAPCAVSP